MYHVFRLTKGNDLLHEIQQFLHVKQIRAGVILSGVGCVDQFHIRLADGVSELHIEDSFEIVSLTGTLSLQGSHLHISFSGKDGRTLGGHLMSGCLINTTAEICILELNDICFERQYDSSTGYDELVIIKKSAHPDMD